MENKSPGSSIISSSTPGPTNLSNSSKLGSGGSPDSTTTNSSGGSVNGGNNSNSGGSAGRPSSPTPNMYSLKWNTQLLALQRSLANLWDNGIGTDAVLLCQGTPLPVHKIVLTAASPYVASVVQTMAQAAHMMPVIVVDIPGEAGKALLSFLYCGEAHVPVHIIPHLVTGAKFLGISGFGDPGVLESLTGMVPESTPGRDGHKDSFENQHQAHQSFHHGHSGVKPEPGDIPHVQLPVVPLPLALHVPHLNSPVQMKKSASLIDRHERSKSRSPFTTPSAYMSPAGDGGRSTSNSPYSNNSATNLSMKKHNVSNSKAGTNRGGRHYVGSTSILDNLLKNPRGHGQFVAGSENSSTNEASDNSDMVQYEAEGYMESSGQNHPTYYYSPAGAGISIGGHSVFEDEATPIDMSDADAPIPAQLLEPNVEYHIGNEFTDRFSGLQNPLADLAKVAAASVQAQQQLAAQQQQTGATKRRGKSAAAQQQDGANGVELISSTGRHAVDTPPPPVKIKIKKPPETITCDICSKRFSNAYNLRVHMEGHSGQVFVCSVCSHASRSRDALRKHFAYRHRELWISGMSAFRKNVPGRKLSISKSVSPNSNNNNNNNDSKNNNNIKADGDADSGNGGGSIIDANGNINLRNTDGTLTISEAFPDKK